MINTDNSKIGNPFPFKVFCQKVIPLAFDESMSYLELLYSLLHYLKETVIPAVNNNADAVEELQNLYTELKSYVDNYFDDLDVQEEINNKLDDMASSGQLADIIAQYLQLAGVLAYDTLNDMKNATNLVNGSIAKTLGNTTYNDGYGAFYKIRTILNTDVVDNDNIVALTNFNNLIAEKIYNQYIEDNRNDINIINNRIDNMLSTKKMVVIGDSYSASTQSGTPLWYKYIEKWDNLETYTNASDGQGYSTGTTTFLQQLQLAKQNLNLEEIDRIYIVGGLNDLGNSNLTPEAFNSDVENTFQYVKDNFPNIKCYVIGILPFQFYNYYSNNQFFTDCKRAYNFQAFLSYTATKYENIIFKSAQYLGLNIPDYFGNLSGNAQRHPSSYGQKVIANFIYNSQRLYGFLDYNNILMTTPLTCDNGNASIDGADNLFITIKIENYNNNNALNINASGLPIARYPIITDEKGNSVFLYITNDKYHIGANTGLDSGTLYANIPINWNS